MTKFKTHKVIEGMITPVKFNTKELETNEVFKIIKNSLELNVDAEKVASNLVFLLDIKAIDGRELNLIAKSLIPKFQKSLYAIKLYVYIRRIDFLFFMETHSRSANCINFTVSEEDLVVDVAGYIKENSDIIFDEKKFLEKHDKEFGYYV